MPHNWCNVVCFVCECDICEVIRLLRLRGFSATLSFGCLYLLHGAFLLRCCCLHSHDARATSRSAVCMPCSKSSCRPAPCFSARSTTHSGRRNMRWSCSSSVMLVRHVGISLGTPLHCGLLGHHAGPVDVMKVFNRICSSFVVNTAIQCLIGLIVSQSLSLHPAMACIPSHEMLHYTMNYLLDLAAESCTA